MTVSSFENRTSFNGDGVSVNFDTPFSFLDAADVQVVLVASDGTETPQVINTNYSISGGNGGVGTVTMTAAPVAGTRLVIYRDTPLTQEVDYTEGGSFPADTHERALDKLTFQNQEQADSLDRALQFPATGAGVVDNRLPAGEAGMALVWNGDLNGFVNSPLPLTDYVTQSSASADAAAQSASDAADSASAAQAAAGTAVDDTAANLTGQMQGYVTAAAGSATAADASANRAEDAATDAETHAQDAHTSAAQAALTVDMENFFDQDENGDLMPLNSAAYSTRFDLDVNGDIQPL